MSIWKVSITLDEMNETSKNTMVEHVGIKFTEMGDDYLVATMPVDHRTKQPYGVMHGGASTVLAETVGSMASNYCVDGKKMFCVGVDINSSHIRMASSGYVKGVARPINLGTSIHVWEIKIYDEKDHLVSFNRLTTKVLKRRTKTSVLHAPIRE